MSPAQTRSKPEHKPSLSQIRKTLEKLSDDEVMIAQYSMGIHLNVRKTNDGYSIAYRGMFNEYVTKGGYGLGVIANALYQLALLSDHAQYYVLKEVY